MSVKVTGTAVLSIQLFYLLGDASPMFVLYLSQAGDTNATAFTVSFDAQGKLNLISEVLFVKDLPASMNLVHGSANFTASGTAELSMGSNGTLVLQLSGMASTLGDVRLDVRTTEPLRPLPDPLPDLSVLLTGTFVVRTDESMSIKVMGTTISSILLFDLLGDASPTFGIHLSRPDGTGTSTVTASFDTAGKLNLVTGALVVRVIALIIDFANGSINFTVSGKAEFMVSAKLLVLQVVSTASTSRDARLEMSTTGSYIMLPDLLPKFAMPHLTGKLTAGADNGSKLMSVKAEAVSFSLTIVL